MGKTWYQERFELHWSAFLGILRYLITQFADESVEIAARAVALAAPMPNAINMYNVAIRDLEWSPFAAFAFSLTLEIVVFLLVEVALRQWDGYLVNPRRYRLTLGVAIGVVAVSVAVVMFIVYRLETHKIMALLPVVSLCSFVGIGLKRWDERGRSDDVQNVAVPEVRTQTPSVNDDTLERRKRVATHYRDNPSDSYQAAADALGINSKATVYNDVKWLEKQDVLHVERDGKTSNVSVNGRYETLMNEGV